MAVLERIMNLLTSQKGGAIIEFKLKQDARVILYEDALDLFRKLMKRTDSKLLFNSVVAYGVNHKTIDKCKKIFLTLQWIV